MATKATFDFGNFTGEDVQRMLGEMAAQGAKIETTPDPSRLGFVRNWFMDFLRSTLMNVGHLDQQGQAAPRFAVEVDVDLEGDLGAVVKQLWNARATDWTVVESPLTYVVTLETLLTHYAMNEKEPQVFLSLGSGPGLYETFLGMLFDRLKIRIICVDFAKEMTRMHGEIIRSVRYPVSENSKTLRSVKNVEPVTGDMTALTMSDRSVDHVFCNNSLQWVPDWKKAIAEMARVSKAGGHLYLFIHRHNMSIGDDKGTVRLDIAKFSVEDTLAELERNHFDIYHIRQIGSRRAGQFGARLDRVFIHAKHTPDEAIVPWQEKRASASLQGVSVRR